MDKSDEWDDPQAYAKQNDRLNSENTVEWEGVGVTAMGGPNGPVCLYVEGETEVILIPNVDVFREKMQKALADFALREKTGLPRRGPRRMQMSKAVPETARKFWNEKIAKAIEMMTDDELARMANSFTGHLGAVFTLTLSHDEEDHTTHSNAFVEWREE